MRQYYVTPILGTGTFADPYRAKPVGQANVAAIIATNPATGAPSVPWALVVVGATAAQAAVLQADTALTALPAVTLDTLLTTLTLAQYNTLVSQLAARGIDTTPLLQSWTLGQLVAYLGTRLVPAYTVGQHSVRDPG